MFEDISLDRGSIDEFLDSNPSFEAQFRTTQRHLRRNKSVLTYFLQENGEVRPVVITINRGNYRIEHIPAIHGVTTSRGFKPYDGLQAILSRGFDGIDINAWINPRYFKDLGIYGHASTERSTTGDRYFVRMYQFEPLVEKIVQELQQGRGIVLTTLRQIIAVRSAHPDYMGVTIVHPPELDSNERDMRREMYMLALPTQRIEFI